MGRGSFFLARFAESDKFANISGGKSRQVAASQPSKFRFFFISDKATKRFVDSARPGWKSASAPEFFLNRFPLKSDLKRSLTAPSKGAFGTLSDVYASASCDAAFKGKKSVFDNTRSRNATFIRRRGSGARGRRVRRARFRRRVARSIFCCSPKRLGRRDLRFASRF